MIIVNSVLPALGEKLVIEAGLLTRNQVHYGMYSSLPSGREVRHCCTSVSGDQM